MKRSTALIFSIFFLLPRIGFPQAQTVLQPSNFSYQGIIKVPGIGFTVEGLAYRRATNTFFTIGTNGFTPYHLYEISLPSPNLTWAGAGVTTVVKDWGNLDINGVLDISGQLIAMKSLWWDDANARLYFAFGSFYANGRDNPVFGYATLDTGVPVIHGPWKVSTQSDTSKGEIREAPPELQAVTGRRFMMFGPESSTSQGMSWGPGLVSVADPDATGVAPGGTVDAAKIVHYPMLYTVANGQDVYYSNFKLATMDQNSSPSIHGDGDVGATLTGQAQGGSANSITLAAGVSNINLISETTYWYVTDTDTGEQLRMAAWNDTTKTATVESNWTKGTPVAGTNYSLYLGSYETPTIVPPLSTYTNNGCGMHQFSWIDLPTKHGLVYFGEVALGYHWYGNPHAHDDSSPDGVLFNNNMDSTAFPGQKVYDHLSINRGGHSEGSAPRWYILDPAQVIAAAQKVKNGTASDADLQIPWTYAGDMQSLGGSVVLLQDHQVYPSDQFWDPVSRNLYLLYGYMPNGYDVSAIQVWHVTDGTDGFPTIAQEPADQTALVGQTAAFSVSAVGTAPLSYQWRKNGVNIAGATAVAYTTPALALSDSGAQYDCMVSNAQGATGSNTALLTVVTSGGPAIAQQPQDATLSQGAGESFSFYVGATGSTLKYQWQREDAGASSFANISGATQSTYTVAASEDMDEALFRCVVSNSLASVTSSTASLHFPGVTGTMAGSDLGLDYTYNRNGMQGHFHLTVPRASLPLGSKVKIIRADQMASAVVRYKHTGMGLHINTWGLEPGAAAQLSLDTVSGVDTSKTLTLAYYNPSSRGWEAVPTTSSGGQWVGTLSHFSTYALMQASPANDLSAAKVYPNPFRPSQGHMTVTFANLPANTRIRLYTLAGEKVKELSADSTGAAVWDAHNDAGASVASGVYFAVVEGNGQKKILNVAVQR